MGRISHAPDARREVISCDDGGPLPLPVLTVVGLKAFHTMVSQMLVAMNREIPEPRPYPFWSSSSSSRTIMPATNSCGSKNSFSVLGDSGSSHGQPALEEQLTWMMMSRQIPAPISDGSPYMPVITYTMAWPMVMIIPNTEKHQQALRGAVADAFFFKPTGACFTFLGSVEERSVLRRVSNLNDLGSSEQLHDQA